MEELYYRDRYRKNCNATVAKVFEKNGKTGLSFDKTIFFPGGGGQISDAGCMYYRNQSGSMEKIDIIDVFENEDLEIIHIVNGNVSGIEVGEEVKLEIDWKRRIDGMCQHTGQHLLSGCFYSMFHRNTKGLHIGKDISQLDIEGSFTEDMVNNIEKKANEWINNNIDIKNYILSKEKAKCFETRRPLPDTDSEIRILEIPDLDTNACCGVHLLNTGDLKLIKIKKYYKHKDGTRFEYLAGKRAVNYVLGRDVVFEKILNRFNCNELNIENAVKNLEVKKDEMYEKLRYISQKYVKNIAENLISESERNSSGLYIVKKIFDNEEPWLLSDIAKYISDSYTSMVLFGNRTKSGGSVYLQADRVTAKEHSYIDFGKNIKEKKESMNIKGGGSKFAAQGIFENEKDIDIFLDNIYHIYIEK